ncbi:DUF6458 family protein [Aeromicrobium sp. 50.2.37]|uniref:DUF6458 family protein n=1 Tax=Aeromicrobium sp. 50.2.37 TaxID=2969305 RepID=UPI00214FBD25|nr:DUF6458 family protein [Aeromicrobium sp. 50.2.37]MCR4511814.1 DUF6458 family protein [Aeromicrobium sp. 50.2.37]
MQIGSSLFLLAAGAILAFAVQDSINGVDLTMVGYILIAVGALGLIVSLVLSGRSRDRRGEVPPPR